MNLIILEEMMTLLEKYNLLWGLRTDDDLTLLQRRFKQWCWGSEIPDYRDKKPKWGVCFDGEKVFVGKGEKLTDFIFELGFTSKETANQCLKEFRDALNISCGVE